MTELTPQIAAVAAVMDEIDNCRNPLPCDLCRQRMQSILDMGATAERERIREMAAELEATVPQARVNGVVLSTVPFADLLGEESR